MVFGLRLQYEEFWKTKIIPEHWCKDVGQQLTTKLKRELSDKEKLERAEAKIKLLEAENELLKKNEMIENGLLTEVKQILNLK